MKEGIKIKNDNMNIGRVGLDKVFLMFFILVVGFAIFVGATDFKDENMIFHYNEGTPIIHYLNDSLVSFTDTGLIFEINLNTNITLEQNSTESIEADEFINDYTWFHLNKNGELIINVSEDYQSGEYSVRFQLENGTNYSDVVNYIFEINATNDAPEFTNNNSTYMYPLNRELEPPVYNVTVDDEEEHYPINFTIVWTDCYNPSWVSSRDCNLFNIVTIDNTTAQFNYSIISNDDVGEYNATIFITEGNHSCPHSHCNSNNYTVNRNNSYNFTVFVQPQLSINASDCDNKNFTEGVEDKCNIIIRTKGRNDYLDLNSSVSFANPNIFVKPNNNTWFFPNQINQSVNNTKNITIIINASKFQIGNWSIDFDVLDLDSFEPKKSVIIPIFVNRNVSLNDVPFVSFVDSKYVDGLENISIDIDSVVSFDLEDDDFLIEDKWDGYNETVDVDVTIVNRDDGEIVSDFSNVNIDYPIYNDADSNNRNNATINITFSPVLSQIGDFKIIFNFSDGDGANQILTTNITVINNTAPEWNESLYNYNFTVNSTIENSIENITNWDLSNNNINASASDIDGDVLYYSVNGVSPPNFDLTSEGILNFIPWKMDVGYWEFNVTVSDVLGKNANSVWKFNVSNINSLPNISEETSEFVVSINAEPESGTHNYYVNQSEIVNIIVRIYDEDLNISESQIDDWGVYDEILNLTWDVVNFTNVTDVLDIDFEYLNDGANYSEFFSSFYCDYDYVGNYTVFLNVSDKSFANDSFNFNLTILDRNEVPSLDEFDNFTTSILDEDFYFDFNTTDRESSEYNGLEYSLENITVGAPNITVNKTTGVIKFNFSNNQDYSGSWEYNISVNDSEDINFEIFKLDVYGYVNVTSLVGSILNFTEGNTSEFNFSVDYAVENTNLTYAVWMDGILVSWNDTNHTTKVYNKTNFTLREIGNYSYNSSNNLTLNISATYSDESSQGAGGYNNFTLLVYNPDYPNLSMNNSWYTNIIHVNENISFSGEIEDFFNNTGVSFSVDLNNYFSDYDYFDVGYGQLVNFSLNKSDFLSSWYSFNGWVLNFNIALPGTYNISVTGYEWDNYNDRTGTNISLGNVSSNVFRILITDPTPDPVETPSSGGSGGSRSSKQTQHYGLKIITPDSIVVSDEDYVELNFSVLNSGEVDLYGINLSGMIELDGAFTNNLEIALNEDWIEQLLIGEMRDYSLRVDVETSAVGRYEITIFGNVTNPKFSDWGQFYVEVQALDESELSQLLIFTEKMVAENPECLELSESLNEVQKMFDDGNLLDIESAARKVINACEESISANEQMRFSGNSINDIVWYSFLSFAGVMIIGFSLYVLHKLKLKSSKFDNYI